MANLNTLPYEIKQLILQHIESTKQLGECRRISKTWDQPAECAMFSKKLHITASNTRPMYMHLIKKPSRAKLIKEIQLDFERFTEFTVPLLPLVITPSIERITSTAFNLNIRFYQTLTEMVRVYGTRLERLKSIPWPSFFKDAHHETALLLKDSLEEMVIPSNDFHRPHEISKHLNEFRCLSRLYVDCAFDTLAQVESIFRGAGNLSEIDLRNCYIDGENGWPHEERLEWMKQHVQKNDDAITINAVELDTSLIEYFLFKYPHIKQLDYDASEGEEWGPDEEMDFNVEFNSQACSWISKIPKYAMTLSTQYRWRTHYRSFAGLKNVFRLNYAEVVELPDNEKTNEISSRVEKDGKRTTQYQFWTSNIFEEDFLDTHVTFLREIGTFTTHLHMNFGYPEPRVDVARMTESMVLFKALEVMNHLEEMKFIASDSLESVELDLPLQYNKRKLSTLHISGAQIQPAMLHTLD